MFFRFLMLQNNQKSWNYIIRPSYHHFIISSHHLINVLQLHTWQFLLALQKKVIQVGSRTQVGSASSHHTMISSYHRIIISPYHHLTNALAAKENLVRDKQHFSRPKRILFRGNKYFEPPPFFFFVVADPAALPHGRRPEFRGQNFSAKFFSADFFRRIFFWRKFFSDGRPKISLRLPDNR